MSNVVANSTRPILLRMHKNLLQEDARVFRFEKQMSGIEQPRVGLPIDQLRKGGRQHGDLDWPIQPTLHAPPMPRTANPNQADAIRGFIIAEQCFSAGLASRIA
jgi:hypothetical protein